MWRKIDNWFKRQNLPGHCLNRDHPYFFFPEWFRWPPQPEALLRSASGFELIERAIVDSVRFIAGCAHRFDETVDHHIIFERHAQFTGESTFEGGVHQTENEHFGNPGAPELFYDSERDETAGANFENPVIKQLDQTDRQAETRQPAIHVAQGNVDVWNADNKAHWFVPDFRD